MWCVFWFARIHYPKSYPPLDKYAIVLLVLLVVNAILLHKTKVYEPKKEHILEHAIMGSLIVSPALYALLVLN